jgi:predicted O-linked N-acetylglucosamine transferase (SPINDLY family)
VLTSDLPPLPSPPPPQDPEKKLRIGFVSSDLRQHSILYFLEPVLDHLDRTQFEIACYHTCLEEDAVSRRLRGRCALWRHEPRTAPTPLASLIRGDAVDVLIELSGHTDGHRLAAVHMRPAPVQMTWLGYPNTTGVAAVDARIVDSITDPAELGADALATERLLRLDPCFVCYRPPADAPNVEARSAAGPIVFGCFGAMQKVGEACLALWAAALVAVPGSRLLLKNRAMNESAPREVILSRLAARGIGPDRVEMRAWTGEINEHLHTYRDVDIALDTTPYNGTTTTCEALYMGVPVITLAGGVHASRVSASLLSATGLGALVARDPAHFAAIAAATASDRAALGALRSGLRTRVLASPLCDERAYASRFGALLRAAWRERCAAG